MALYVQAEDARDAVLSAQEVYDKVSEAHYQVECEYRTAKKVYTDAVENPTWYTDLFILMTEQDYINRLKNYGHTTALFHKAQNILKDAQKKYDGVSVTLGSFTEAVF
jgi:hypothetical protein